MGVDFVEVVEAELDPTVPPRLIQNPTRIAEWLARLGEKEDPLHLVDRRIEDTLPLGIQCVGGSERLEEWAWAHGAAFNHPGVQPFEHSEDAFLIDPGEEFFAVADGLGGCPDGELASYCALLALARTRGRSLSADQLFQHAVAVLDECRVRGAHGDFLLDLEAKTTLTLLRKIRTSGEGVEIEGATKGDCRILLAYPHSREYEVWEEADTFSEGTAFLSGILGEERANTLSFPLREELLKMSHPDGNIVNNGIAALASDTFNENGPTVWQRTVPRGTRFALMTDGIYKMLFNQEIAQVLLGEGTWEEQSRRIRAIWLGRQAQMRTWIKARGISIERPTIPWQGAEGQTVQWPLGRFIRRKENGQPVISGNIDHGTVVLGELQ
jgi:serine/threonine protein phosphatase PrpC